MGRFPESGSFPVHRWRCWCAHGSAYWTAGAPSPCVINIQIMHSRSLMPSMKAFNDASYFIVEVRSGFSSARRCGALAVSGFLRQFHSFGYRNGRWLCSKSSP